MCFLKRVYGQHLMVKKKSAYRQYKNYLNKYVLTPLCFNPSLEPSDQNLCPNFNYRGNYIN
jgi:hypothetical protein